MFLGGNPIVGDSIAHIGFLIMNIEAFADRHMFWAFFAATAVCLPIFLHMWKKTRQSIPLPADKSNALRIGTTLLVCAFTLMLVFVEGSSYVVIGRFNVSPVYGAEAGIFDSSSLFMYILTVVIMVPIVEELVFRGVMLNRLLVIAPTWLAVLISGIIFGLMHTGSPLRIIFSAIGGVWFALLYVRFRNLLLCIISHMVFNFAGSNVAIFTFIDSTASSFPVFSIVMPIIYMIGIGGLFVLLCPPATFGVERTE